MITDVIQVDRKRMRQLALDAEGPTINVAVSQVRISSLSGAEAIGAALQKAGVRGTRINVAAIHGRTLVPVDLARKWSPGHAARNRGGWERQSGSLNGADGRPRQSVNPLGLVPNPVAGLLVFCCDKKIHQPGVT